MVNCISKGQDKRDENNIFRPSKRSEIIDNIIDSEIIDENYVNNITNGSSEIIDENYEDEPEIHDVNYIDTNESEMIGKKICLIKVGTVNDFFIFCQFFPILHLEKSSKNDTNFSLPLDENFVDTTNGSEFIDENYVDPNGAEIIDENYVDESEIMDENYIDHPNGSEIIGNMHALKEYDQFAINTSCFRCAISRNLC